MTKTIISASVFFLLSGLDTARADVVVSASLFAPPVPVPAFVPPAPVLRPPVIPVQAHYVAPRVVVSSPTVTGGQWVHTAQYGWVYMPYGEQYAYAHPSGAYAYVYYPAVGWRWLTAPWLIGSGPYPYFGAHGPFAYAWYRGLHRAGHPWGAHYARVHGHLFVAPRAAPPARPTHGLRAPAHARTPVRVHTPARPAFTPRAVTTPRPRMVAQRNVGSAMRGPAVARGGFADGRALGRR